MLRERKAREEKPFAVMVAGAASIVALAAVDVTERALLQSPERPIVLLRKASGVDDALPGVAPGLAWLGVMLPYTPLQYLLFHEAAGRPQGLSWLDAAQDLVLVMTSANPGGEPLVIGNAEATQRLPGIADALLTHDRDILIRCDDSVVRVGAGNAPQFVRRARGFTPRAVRLARSGPAVVALGGWFKNTLCVTRGEEAFVSQHIGDLDNAPTCAALSWKRSTTCWGSSRCVRWRLRTISIPTSSARVSRARWPSARRPGHPGAAPSCTCRGGCR